jgi:hypothetical protein
LISGIAKPADRMIKGRLRSKSTGFRVRLKRVSTRLETNRLSKPSNQRDSKK